MSTSGETQWRGRPALRLANRVVQLSMLQHGGHLAELRFCDESGLPRENVLWEPPWMVQGQALDSELERTETAGICGHALCLDYFGAPSADEAARGLGIHGEAAAMEWRGAMEEGEDSSCASWRVSLPAAGLDFARRVTLRRGESVFLIEETVTNRAAREHAFHWVQHVTFGPPFLSAGESDLAVSAVRGFTDETAYGERSLVAHGREFKWPMAPAAGIDGEVDLSHAFTHGGLGILAGLEMDPQRDMQFLVAFNRRMQVGVGYCFRRRDFPWMSVWEENRSREEAPWEGRSQARGMEFGTTPLPLGREETLRRGARYGVPCWRTAPALGSLTARYACFLFAMPEGLERLSDVVVEEDEVAFLDATGEVRVRVQAGDLGRFLRDDAQGTG